MLPDRVSNPGPLTYESGALPIALRVKEKPGLLNSTFEWQDITEMNILIDILIARPVNDCH